MPGGRRQSRNKPFHHFADESFQRQGYNLVAVQGAGLHLYHGGAVAVDVSVSVAVAGGVSVSVGVEVGVSVAVGLGVAVSVAVGDGVGVWVAVSVGVGVGVGVSVAVAVGVIVGGASHTRLVVVRARPLHAWVVWPVAMASQPVGFPPGGRVTPGVRISQ